MEATKEPSNSLRGVLDTSFAAVDKVLRTFQPRLRVQEVGEVTFVSQGIARVRGLRGVQSEELVRFPGNRLGQVFNLDPEEVGIILLDESEDLQAGTEVRPTGRVLDVPVGRAVLGRVVDPMGRPLDDKGPLRGMERRPVEREAPAIMDRAPVTVPLQTGLKVVDALIPIGRGQR
ncbi:MAG: F0F1 ATP synthase subunit alpha, partial [Thermodesulfobacteriota bacterium]